MSKPQKKSLTYAEALNAAKQAMTRGMSLPTSINNPPHPQLPLDSATQVKLVTATTIMASVGRLPGHINMNQRISFRKINPKILNWLENKVNFPVNRDFAPLGADYTQIFWGGQRLPKPEISGKFFSQLIHCLVIETQLLIAMEYFYGLGLDEPTFSPTKPGKWLSLDATSLKVIGEIDTPPIDEIQLGGLGNINLLELHGHIFLDYCTIMIRSQWDKMVRMSCLVYGINPDWDKINEGLDKLENIRGLPPSSEELLKAFVNIGRERLHPNGWLKPYRDTLLHKIGSHTAGVIPHKKSLETTRDLWDKMRDEHDWLREGMIAALSSYLLAGWSQP